MKKFFAILPVVLTAVWSHAQEIPQHYLQTAFANNLVLKKRNISLEKSLIALQEARSLFLPTSTLEGQYLLARGGRTIDIPVGDLLNPVYTTLNQMTGSEKFPTVANVREQLNPDRFYDVRVRTSMPLYNADLAINRDISKQQVKLQEEEVKQYKRELVRELKQAYYNYLTAGKAVDIYRYALTVVERNLKVNQSLQANGKGLPAYISRAESEVQQVRAQLHNAENEQMNARAYFNFLLNRSLYETIDTPSSDARLPEMPSVNDSSVLQREELRSLKLSQDINQNMMRMNQQFRKPKLNAFLDLGAQGFDVNSDALFYMSGLQLQVPIFTGKRNLYKIESARLEAKAIEYNRAQTKQQLELAVLVSRNNLVNELENYRSALKQQEAAEKYFTLIDRGYREGVNTFIELLDARNQLTQSQLQANITRYRVWARYADYERQAAIYPL